MDNDSDDDFDSMEIQEGKDMWVDKYEPKKLEDMVGQKNVVHALMQMAKTKLVTHMLFAGPAGVGKTTAAKCFAIELLGDTWKSNFEVFNASSEDRGIDFVRTDLKRSASTQAVGAPYRIIFLDEADGMTPDAQNALRGTMKQFSNSTIFILACNYMNRIITPISRSRCSLFRFESIGRDDVIGRLNHILAKENTYLSQDIINTIADATKGDLRGAINWLQVANAQIEHGLTEDVVLSGFSVFKSVDISSLINNAIDGNLVSVRNLVDGFLVRGVSAQEILSSISYQVVDMDIDLKLCADILRMVAVASARINDGSPERIQFNSIFAAIAASHFRNGVDRVSNTQNRVSVDDNNSRVSIPDGIKPTPFKIGR